MVVGMKKLLIILILLAVLVGAGCAEQESGPAEDTENIAHIEENTSVVNESVGTLGPVLEIVTVTADYNNLIIKVRNVGDETAESVFAGTMGVIYSNSRSAEYLTIEDYTKYAWPVVANGLTGEIYSYETEYTYKDTPNLIIHCRLWSIDYIGDIEPGDFGETTVSAYSESHYDDLLKIAWVEGHEDEFVIY
jgi:hypothetical protein